MAAEYISVDRICRMLGVSRSSVYLWIRRGIFPAGTKIGPRARRWRTDIVEAWMRGREVQGR